MAESQLQRSEYRRSRVEQLQTGVHRTPASVPHLAHPSIVPYSSAVALAFL